MQIRANFQNSESVVEVSRSLLMLNEKRWRYEQKDEDKG